MTTQSIEILSGSSLEGVFEQPETVYENILEFFEKYIKTYYAYKDDPAYKATISFLIKYYVDLIYNYQPSLFKELFEQQTISRDIIDLLLVSIGLPEKLIRELTTTSKFVIMKSFSDFERYKGTIKFFRSIGGAFQDVMSYYELYIDYDQEYINPVAKYLLTIDTANIPEGSYIQLSSTENNYYIWFNLNKKSVDPEITDSIGIEINYSETSTSHDIATAIIEKLNLTKEFYLNVNSIDVLEIQLAQHGAPLNQPSAGTTYLEFKVLDSGRNKGSWILRPRPIYIHPKMEKVEEVFPYYEVYQKIPTLLIPEDQLSELKARDEIVLPTKSNIILLDYTQTTESSQLMTLFFTILMEYIGDDYFPVFFTGSSGTTTITYNTAFIMWYYLLAKYYNVTLEGVDLAWHNVMGTNKITNFVLEDIPRLEEEYNQIETREQLYKFYFDNIESQFSRPYENEKPTIPILSETLRKMDAELWEYVETRLSTAESVEQDIRFLLDELYASIILSFDRYKDNAIVFKYIPLILGFLSQITTNIKATDSYKIVYNLKPFHTEILDLSRNKVIIDDKFNALLFSDELVHWFDVMFADILHMSDRTFFTFKPKNDCTSLGLNSIAIPNYRIFQEDGLDISHLLAVQYLKLVITNEVVSDTTYPWFKNTAQRDSLGLNSVFDKNFKTFVEEKIDNISKLIISQNQSEETALILNSVKFTDRQFTNQTTIHDFKNNLGVHHYDRTNHEFNDVSIIRPKINDTLIFENKQNSNYTHRNLKSNLDMNNILESKEHILFNSDTVQLSDNFSVNCYVQNDSIGISDNFEVNVE